MRPAQPRARPMKKERPKPPLHRRAGADQAGLPVVLKVIVVVIAFGLVVALLLTTPPGLVVTLIVVRCGLAPPETAVSSFVFKLRNVLLLWCGAEESTPAAQSRSEDLVQ